jgi:hypothetical protein
VISGEWIRRTGDRQPYDGAVSTAASSTGPILPPVPDATSVSAMLALLESRRSSFTERALTGQLSWWIGSGVSRTRLPDVGSLLRRLLGALYDRVVSGDPACAATGALKQLISMSAVPGVDPTQRPDAWPQLEQVVTALSSKYSDALDVSFAPGGTPEDICWDVLRLQDVYSDPATVPDAEHRLLAVLVAEGIVRELVTTNWDPLIERAWDQCTGAGDRRLKVVARPADIPGRGNEPQILKIHGCAERAKADEVGFRRFLVGTRTQITAWDNSPELQPLREALRVLARQTGAVFVGLSGQDYDIQAALFVAGESLGAPSLSTPSVFFSSTRIEEPHRQVLRVIHKAGPYAAQQAAIDSACLLPVYAKPLLGALYIFAMLDKLALAASLGTAEMTPLQATLCGNALTFLRQLACSYDAIHDGDTRWRRVSSDLAGFMAGFATLYMEGKTLPHRWRYLALWGRDRESLRTDRTFAAQREYRLLVLCGALSHGERLGLWTVAAVTDLPGVIRVHTRSGTCDLYVGRDPLATVAMEERDVFRSPSCKPPLVVFPHANSPRRPLARVGSPKRRLPGGASEEHAHEVWMLDLLEESKNPDDLAHALVVEFQTATTP